ncbi:MAG: hypothetical protein KDG54_11205 [Geminicoccaceae bacterium]|nr:hypothetical protein [Geminicoccaceae bacterium]
MSGSPDILLIDADMLLYRVLASMEVETRWGEEVWTLSINEAQARDAVERRIATVIDEVAPASLPYLCFSGSRNFRFDVYPLYKSNRASTRKPMCYRVLKEWLRDTERTSRAGRRVRYAEEPVLEGDDLMSLMATHPAAMGRTIIVTDDKDLKQVPGRLYRFPDYDGKKPKTLKREVREVSTEEADRFFYVQTIAGDVADGYPGAPGFGATTAEDLLRKKLMLEPMEHELQRGPRVGQTETRWERVSSPSPWDTVLSCYAKAGLDESDALQNARVARMLRHGEYDFKKQEVRLWEPSRS